MSYNWSPHVRSLGLSSIISHDFPFDLSWYLLISCPPSSFSLSLSLSLMISQVFSLSWSQFILHLICLHGRRSSQAALSRWRCHRKSCGSGTCRSRSRCLGCWRPSGLVEPMAWWRGSWRTRAATWILAEAAVCTRLPARKLPRKASTWWTACCQRNGSTTSRRPSPCTSSTNFAYDQTQVH